MKKVFVLLLLLLSLTACGKQSRPTTDALSIKTGSMELQYATRFAVDYYEGGYSLITIRGTDKYLLVPENAPVPKDLSADAQVLFQPLTNLYVASSSSMDFFLKLGALDRISTCSTSAENWSIPEIKALVADETIAYVGKYSAPDYEQLLNLGCTMAIENTMIEHTPEIREKLISLGIPVLVDNSSYENHPLGRVEWMKLYGLLCGKTAEAEQAYADGLALLGELQQAEATGKTIGFFYISSAGYANVRKPGDYITKMIELAGGTYILTGVVDADENTQSTMNMDLESFYATCKDCDILIYNNTTEPDLNSIDKIIDKCPLLADFKAVQEGNIWCTSSNMFQQITATPQMIADFHTILTDESGTAPLSYLIPLK